MEIKSVACRKSFTDALVELGKKDKNIVAVTTDARGSVTLTDLQKNCLSSLLSAVLQSRML